MIYKNINFDYHLQIIKKEHKKRKMFYYCCWGIIIVSSIAPFLIPLFIKMPDLGGLSLGGVQGVNQSGGQIMGNMGSPGSQTNSPMVNPMGGLSHSIGHFMKIFWDITLITTFTNIIGFIGLFKFKKKKRIEKVKKHFEQIVNKVPKLDYEKWKKMLLNDEIKGQHSRSGGGQNDLETGFLYFTLNNGNLISLDSSFPPTQDNNPDVIEKMKKLKVLPKITYYLPMD